MYLPSLHFYNNNSFNFFVFHIPNIHSFTSIILTSQSIVISCYTLTYITILMLSSTTNTVPSTENSEQNFPMQCQSIFYYITTLVVEFSIEIVFE